MHGLSKTRRGRIQFSLAAVMLCVAVFCIAMAWLGPSFRKPEPQRPAILLVVTDNAVHISSVAGVPALIELLDAPFPRVREGAAARLGAIGKDAEPALPALNK